MMGEGMSSSSAVREGVPREAPPQAAPRAGGRRSLRIPLRIKVLVLVSVVLLSAVGTYLYLATSLYTRDKLAYIYDLNASRVGSLSAQTRVELEVLQREGALIAMGLAANSAVGRAALGGPDSELVRVQLFTGVGEGAIQERSWLNPQALEAMNLTAEDLEFVRQQRPLPLEAVLKDGGMLVQNSSLPPDGALLTVLYPWREGSVVAVDLRHQRLLRIFGRSDLHETYLVNEAGEVMAHPEVEQVVSRQSRADDPLVKQALSAEVDQGVTEVATAQGAHLGGYGKVGLGRLWVITQIPKEAALAANRELIYRSVLFAVAVLLAGILVSIYLSRVVTAPLQKLEAAAEVIGRGRFDVAVDVTSRDEIGELAEAFSRMTAALKETQAQLVQSEKMAAFGQLGAGITHEVKNPMTGIVGFAQLAQRRVHEPEKVAELLKMIEKEGLRCKDILVNFLKFARSPAGERERLELNALVEESGAMLRHQLSIHDVTMQLELSAQAPVVEANGAELQQVLMNLAINAQQAMPKGGRVRLSTHVEQGMAQVRVADNGPGIPPHIRQKIFEPFFSTKQKGEGTGLGLSVSFGIIQAHGGSLQLESVMGQGSTFVVNLPLAPPHQDSVAAAG